MRMAGTTVIVLALFMLGSWLLVGCGGNVANPVGTAAAPAEPSAGPQAVLIGFKSKPGAADEALVRGASGQIKYTFTLVPVIAASVPEQALQGLRKNPRISYIEPDAEAQATAETTPWGISQVKANQVWSTTTGATVPVAVIDTGIDYRHADLAPNYKGGYNFVKPRNTPLDDNGHGTHVAGTIAAASNNQYVVGAAPAASLYALKVLDRRGSGSYSNIIAALQWCVTNKMKVASMSLGGQVGSTSLENACSAAAAGGVLLVAAAGNDGNTAGTGNTVDYPAVYPSVVAVAASDSNNVRAYFSSTGPQVALTAPGVNVLSDKLGGTTTTMSGTSMATPHVSGVAALLIAANPALAPADARARLTSTAQDLGAAGWDPLYGYGLVNAAAALAP